MTTTATFSQEIFNAREQLLTGDLMRLQALANRDLLDLFGGMTRPLPGVAFTHTTERARQSGLIREPTWTPNAGVFTGTVGPGFGFLEYDPGTLTADQSSYQVVRWVSTVVTFTSPDVTLGRIDTIVATPTQTPTDSASRNILTDPVARTVAAQSVNKTSNPTAALTVIAGTPSSAPQPASIPTGTIGIFHVYVPASAADAVAFGTPLLRTFRQTAFPFAALTGVMSGFQLSWDQQADPASTTATLSVPAAMQRICIDGEMIEWFGGFTSSGTTGGIIQDSTANPFGSAAPATNSRVYYIYAVGGKNLPYTNYNTVAPGLSPIVLVESTVPPFAGTAIPSASLTTPNGAVSKACLVGVGYTFRNTTRRQACVQVGNMIYGAAGSWLDSATVTGTAAQVLLPSIHASSMPQGSQQAAAIVNLVGASAAANHSCGIFGGTAGAISPLGLTGVGSPIGAAMIMVAGANGSPTGETSAGQGMLYWPVAVGTPRWWANGGFAAADTINLWITGYTHGVPRLDGMAGC